LRKWALWVAIGIIIAAVIATTLAFIRTAPAKRPLIPPQIEAVIKGANESLQVIVLGARPNGTVPTNYTCVSRNWISPPIEIRNVPPNTKCLTLIVYDPDAPRGTFYHWILFNIPPSSIVVIPKGIPPALREALDIGVQGVNSAGRLGYYPPCPPPGSKHRYVFMVFALDKCLELYPGAPPLQVIEAMRGHVIAYGYEVLVFSR